MKSRSPQCATCRYSIAKPIGTGIRTVLVCASAHPPAERVALRALADAGECPAYEREPGAEG